jgi:immune inhibitor A
LAAAILFSMVAGPLANAALQTGNEGAGMDDREQGAGNREQGLTNSPVDSQHPAPRSLLSAPSLLPAPCSPLAARCSLHPSLVPANPAVYRGRSAPQDPGETAAAVSGRVSGDFNVLVLLVEFQDVGHNAASTVDHFTGELFDQAPGASSVSRYYTDNSYGKVLVTGEVTAVWLRSAYNMSEYGADGPQGIDTLNGPVYRLVTEAVALADPLVDFSRFDLDRDGCVDHLCVVHAGQGQESSFDTNCIWSHRWEDFDEPKADTVAVRQYTMLSEFSPVGTFAHEFGHDIGLPDLYDYTGASLGVGSWDLMASGSWADNGNTPVDLSAWCKYKLGWLAPTELAATEGDLALPMQENNSMAYIIWIRHPDEFFLIENRQKAGWDRFLPGAGMLIWHVDGSVSDNNNKDHRLVDLEEADEASAGDSPDDAGDPWHDSPDGFNPYSVPSSAGYIDPPSWWVFGIGHSADVMNFSVKTVGTDVGVRSLEYDVFTPVNISHAVRATIDHIVGREAVDVSVDCTISRGAVFFCSTTLVRGLAPGGSYPLEWNWTPPFAGNFIVTVRVYTYNDSFSGNDESTGIVHVITPLFFDDVEKGQGGWDAGVSVPLVPGLWHIVSQDQRYGDARSPDHSWWCGFNGTGQYRRGTSFFEYYLESPVIDLSRTESAVLAFYQKYDISSGLPTGLGLLSDSGTIEASSNLGATWRTLDSVSGTGGNWSMRFYDISNFSHSLFRFRFVLKSNMLLMGRGWYIDDVAVYATGNIYDVSLGRSPNVTGALPGRPVFFNLTVDNAGNKEDSYQLSWEAPEGVTVSLARTSLTLGFFESAQVRVVAGVNGKAEAGSLLEFRITAVSGGNRQVSCTATAGLLVLQAYSVGLEAESGTVHSDPGSNATFRVNVTNLGNGPDRVTLALGGTDSARARLSWADLTLGAWEVAVVDIELAAPGNATAGSELAIRLTARSSGGPSANLTLQAVINRTRGVSMGAGRQFESAPPSGHALFNILMRNLGNGLEEFTVTSELPAGWSAAHDVVVTLSPFAGTEFQLDVSVPSDAAGGPSTVVLRAAAAGGAQCELSLKVDVQLPDLYVSGLTIEPQISDEGGTLALRVTAGNSGTANATAVTVIIYDNGRKIKEWTMDRMAPGYSELLIFRLKLPRGNHLLSAIVSTPDRELSSTNNQLQGDARVRAGSSFIPAFGAGALVAAALALLAFRSVARSPASVHQSSISRRCGMRKTKRGVS